MTSFTRSIGRYILLALVALALFPPGPSAPRALAQEQPTVTPQASSTIFLPSIMGGGAAPDLSFEPAELALAPGEAAGVIVRVNPIADLRGASFQLDGAPDSLTSTFTAADDGASGTLTVAAGAATPESDQTLTVKGANGANSWVGSLKLSVSSTTAKTLFVNPQIGNDSNSGTQSKPFKTLAKALSKAKAGDKVQLAAGVYGPGFSGDQFPASGLLVASGVTIVGALSGGFPVVTLLGNGNGVGLNFLGDATVRNLIVNNFGRAVQATQGKQNLSTLFVGLGGIFLSGSAQTTLVGSTIILNLSSSRGVSVLDQARFTMDGGKITGGSPNCGHDAIGVELRDLAQATLKNGARLENIPGFALFMREAAKATLNGARITRDNPAGCTGRPSVDVRGSASLTFDGATIASAGGQDDVGITTADNVTLTLKDTDVQGYTGTGIRLTSNEKLTIEGGSIRGNGFGIQARPFNDGTGSKKTPIIKISGASLVGNNIGIEVDAPILKLRNSFVIFNQIGIEILGTVGGLPVGDSCAFACVNLGFGTDKGNNNFTGNTITAVLFHSNFQAVTGAPAVGNIWNGNTQGTDSSGLYTTGLTIRSGDPLADGKNFSLGTDGVITF